MRTSYPSSHSLPLISLAKYCFLRAWEVGRLALQSPARVTARLHTYILCKNLPSSQDKEKNFKNLMLESLLFRASLGAWEGRL